MRTPLIATIIALLVLSTLGCVGQEKTPEMSFGEEWYGKGGIAVRSVAVGDVDRDGVPELITGGVVGTADRGIIIGDRPPPEPTPFKSQLRIWHWTGSALHLEQSEEWVSNVVSCSK